MSETTAEHVARWMLEAVTADGHLQQYQATAEIEERWPEFVYENQDGNRAINRLVLVVFRELTAGTVVWDRWALSWRLRQPGDQPSRKQG